MDQLTVFILYLKIFIYLRKPNLVECGNFFQGGNEQYKRKASTLADPGLRVGEGWFSVE